MASKASTYVLRWVRDAVSGFGVPRFKPPALRWTRCQARVSRAKRSAMSSTAARIVDLAGEPLLGRVVEDRAADREAFHDARLGAVAKAASSSALRRFEAEEDDAAAPRIVACG